MALIGVVHGGQLRNDPSYTLGNTLCAARLVAAAKHGCLPLHGLLTNTAEGTCMLLSYSPSYSMEPSGR